MFCANYIHFESPTKEYPCHQKKWKKGAMQTSSILSYASHEIGFCFYSSMWSCWTIVLIIAFLLSLSMGLSPKNRTKTFNNIACFCVVLCVDHRTTWHFSTCKPISYYILLYFICRWLTWHSILRFIMVASLCGTQIWYI